VCGGKFQENSRECMRKFQGLGQKIPGVRNPLIKNDSKKTKSKNKR
jgi:hypothetical protein